MFLCFQSVTGSKTRVSVFIQNTLLPCFVKTQVFKIKTPVFCQNTNTCFQSVIRRCFLTCLDSKHPLLQCTICEIFVGDIIRNSSVKLIEFEPVVQEEMLFKDISYLELLGLHCLHIWALSWVLRDRTLFKRQGGWLKFRSICQILDDPTS